MTSTGYGFYPHGGPAHHHKPKLSPQQRDHIISDFAEAKLADPVLTATKYAYSVCEQYGVAASTVRSVLAR